MISSTGSDFGGDVSRRSAMCAATSASSTGRGGGGGCLIARRTLSTTSPEKSEKSLPREGEKAPLLLEEAVMGVCGVLCVDSSQSPLGITSGVSVCWRGRGGVTEGSGGGGGGACARLDGDLGVRGVECSSARECANEHWLPR
jgi:hypothetical protein